MRVVEECLDGAVVFEDEPLKDERGSFTRTFCAREFEALGISPSIAQVNTSFNVKAGTLRGMHYQAPPAAEDKIVRCIRGVIYDVIIDLRQDSPSYMEHYGVELSCENGRSLYVPKMFAHGFQTLEDNTEVLYFMSEFYNAECSRGLCHNDPAFEIQWPVPVSSLSERDANWPPCQGRVNCD